MLFIIIKPTRVYGGKFFKNWKTTGEKKVIRHVYHPKRATCNILVQICLLQTFFTVYVTKKNHKHTKDIAS